MGEPHKHCQINTITLTNTGPVLPLEEYGSYLQIISHTCLTFSEPLVFINDLQEWADRRREQEHLWKTTTYVTTAHSNCSLTLHSRLPCICLTL